MGVVALATLGASIYMVGVLVVANILLLTRQLSFSVFSHTTNMKNAFAIAVAALLLDSAVASPLNVETRQVGSTSTSVLSGLVVNIFNRVVAAQVPLRPAHTRRTTP
jgi:hypothetical protein